jgi:hypothetical protein
MLAKNHIVLTSEGIRLTRLFTKDRSQTSTWLMSSSDGGLPALREGASMMGWRP